MSGIEKTHVNIQRVNRTVCGCDSFLVAVLSAEEIEKKGASPTCGRCLKSKTWRAIQAKRDEDEANAAMEAHAAEKFEKGDAEDYDYAQDDRNFDAARERALTRGR